LSHRFSSDDTDPFNAILPYSRTAEDIHQTPQIVNFIILQPLSCSHFTVDGSLQEWPCAMD
jgi:hypothetical protein